MPPLAPFQHIDFPQLTRGLSALFGISSSSSSHIDLTMSSPPSYLSRRYTLNIDIDIDGLLNPYIPRPPRRHLPRLVLRFLGYRTGPNDKPQLPLGNVLIVAWSFLGTLASLSLIYLLCRSTPSFRDVDGGNTDVPLILGSFGAAAVLQFHSISSPLAQPRNAVFGQLLSSIIGISISKLLANISSPTTTSTYLAGALSASLSVVLMGLTNTVHPPAGATALLAVTDPSVSAMGWLLVPFVLLSCAGMLLVACIVNNLQRRFPLYWWTDGEVGGAWRRDRSARGWDGVQESAEGTGEGDQQSREPFRAITISDRGIVIPASVYLRPEERVLLDGIVKRLGT